MVLSSFSSALTNEKTKPYYGSVSYSASYPTTVVRPEVKC